MRIIVQYLNDNNHDILYILLKGSFFLSILFPLSGKNGERQRLRLCDDLTSQALGERDSEKV